MCTYQLIAVPWKPGKSVFSAAKQLSDRQARRSDLLMTDGLEFHLTGSNIAMYHSGFISHIQLLHHVSTDIKYACSSTE